MQHLEEDGEEPALQSYTYETLKNPRDIRLLTLQPGVEGTVLTCTLATVSLDDCGNYDALSYVWGELHDRKPLICSGRTLMITNNLHAALLQFKQDSRFDPLWVDAVCINQEDLSERSLQVQIMGDIYSSARSTLAWLGPRSDDDCEAYGIIRWLDDVLQTIPEFRDSNDWTDMDFNTIGSKLNTDFMQDLNTQRLTHVAYLITRSWFHRVWVIQEVAKSQKVYLLCGNESLPFDTLNNAVLVFHACSLQTFLKPTFPNFRELTAMGAWWIGVFKNDISKADNIELITCLTFARDFQSTDHRDKIYALTGMVSPEHAVTIRPDYDRSPREVFRELAISDLTKLRKLRILSLASYSVSSLGRYGLPSWSPDWSVAGENILLGLISPFYEGSSAAGRSEAIFSISPDLEVLTVKGRRLTKILEVTTRKHFPTHRPVIVPPGCSEYELPYQAYSTLLGFLKDCHSVGLAQDCVLPENYDESRYNVFSTALTGMGFTRDQASITADESKQTCWVIQKIVDLHRELCLGHLNREKIDEEFFLPALSLLERTTRGYYRLAKGRVFCRTDTNHLGWVPADGKPGDCVCLLYGGSVLYVLRPDENDYYRLIGECYLHGLMDGGGLDLPGIDDEDFHVR